MRLGANGFPYENPEQWLQRVKELKASTVTAPISCQDQPELKRAYQQLIQAHHLSVGEVGIWMAIPIGWFLADIVGLFALRKSGKSLFAPPPGNAVENSLL